MTNITHTGEVLSGAEVGVFEPSLSFNTNFETKLRLLGISFPKRLSPRLKLTALHVVFMSMKLKLAVIVAIALPSWLLLSEMAISMPLKPGAYNWASNYIQIAKKGSRLCYQGFSARGTFISSLSPDPQKSGLYRLDGSKDLLIRQDSPTQISYGAIDNMLPYQVDPKFGTQLSSEMQQCLNSSKPYSKQQTARR